MRTNAAHNIACVHSHTPRPDTWQLLSAERLCGSEQYACDACGCKRDAQKRLVIVELSDALVIHVNRARWLLHGSKEKLQTHVAFPPRDFDLAEFCAEAEVEGGLNTVYDLKACVYHHGKGMETGHYSVVCANPRGDWVRYNDGKVDIATEEEVEQSQAYLLFYQRQRPQERRQQVAR